MYPIFFIDVVHFSVSDNGIIRKLAAYTILGLSSDKHKEVLSLFRSEKMKTVNTGYVFLTNLKIV